jgi:hypothetical protein
VWFLRELDEADGRRGEGGRERRGRKTNDTGFAAVVHINQIAVQVHVLISSDLHRCIRRLFSLGARWEGEFGEEAVGREGDQGGGFRGEFIRVRGD